MLEITLVESSFFLFFVSHELNYFISQVDSRWQYLGDDVVENVSGTL
jgi:hypothetical protein